MLSILHLTIFYSAFLPPCALEVCVGVQKVVICTFFAELADFSVTIFPCSMNFCGCPVCPALLEAGLELVLDSGSEIQRYKAAIRS